MEIKTDTNQKMLNLEIDNGTFNTNPKELEDFNLNINQYKSQEKILHLKPASIICKKNV